MVKRVAYFFILALIGLTINSVNVMAISLPVADAGGDQFALGGDTVILDGSQSSDPADALLTFHWEQTIVGDEPVVELFDAETAFLSFTMPVTATGGTQLFFTLEVTNPDGFSAQDTSTVTNALRIPCDVTQGFQFSDTLTTTVGHLTYLQIGDTILDSDLTVIDPENPDATIVVVGVMEQIDWNSEQVDPMQLISRLSSTNKTAVDHLLETLTGDEKVLMKFNIYDHNSPMVPTTGNYYKSFHTNRVSTVGTIEYIDNVPQITMGQSAEIDVTDPANYKLSLSVATDDSTAHLLHRVQTTGLDILWPWGGTEATVPNIVASTDTINFGIIEHGQSPSQVLTIENTGTSPLHIGTVGQSTILADPYRITQDSCSEQSVAAGGTCDITVTFDESLLTSAIVPATGALAAGLLFFGVPGRRNRFMKLLMAVIVVGTLISCGADRTWKTGAFDIPSNDSGTSTLYIGVMGDWETE